MTGLQFCEEYLIENMNVEDEVSVPTYRNGVIQ